MHVNAHSSPDTLLCCFQSGSSINKAQENSRKDAGGIKVFNYLKNISRIRNARSYDSHMCSLQNTAQKFFLWFHLSQ